MVYMTYQIRERQCADTLYQIYQYTGNTIAQRIEQLTDKL